MKYCSRCRQQDGDQQRFCSQDRTLLSLPDPYRLVGFERTAVLLRQIAAALDKAHTARSIACKCCLSSSASIRSRGSSGELSRSPSQLLFITHLVAVKLLLLGFLNEALLQGKDARRLLWRQVCAVEP